MRTAAHPARPRWRGLAAGLCAPAIALSSGCGEVATLPANAGFGPNPALPAPHPTLIPTVNIAPATGWPGGAKPLAAAGLAVEAFARDLDHPRWIYVLPNGDVLVAETNAPPKPADGRGIKGALMKLFMARAGASALLVADDVGNVVWRVTAAAARR